MTTSFALLILSALASAWLIARAMQDHRDAMAGRSMLLDEATEVLVDAETIIGPDQFPIVKGRARDGRHVKLDVIADSLITRRLPQLWLRVTLYEAAAPRPTIGALARPTGSEYYSLVHDMQQWMAPPGTEAPILLRGDGTATRAETERVLCHFADLFADPTVKEAVISPKGVRIIQQAAQGERATHLFLRQSRFPITAIPAADMNKAIALAIALSEVLKVSEEMPVTEAA